jgi:hypothetical protein
MVNKIQTLYVCEYKLPGIPFRKDICSVLNSHTRTAIKMKTTRRGALFLNTVSYGLLTFLTSAHLSRVKESTSEVEDLIGHDYVY